MIKNIKFKKHPVVKNARLGIFTSDKFDFYIEYIIRIWNGKEYVHSSDQEKIGCESSHDKKDGKWVSKKYSLIVMDEKKNNIPLKRIGITEQEVEKIINNYSSNKYLKEKEDKLREETFELLGIELEK
jgi:hypothetical protein